MAGAFFACLKPGCALQGAVGPGPMRRTMTGRRVALEEPVETVFVPTMPSVVAINRHVVTSSRLVTMNGTGGRHRCGSSLGFETYETQQEEK